MKNNNYDVIILGSGIGGLELSIILSRNNLNVLVIDKAKHPRFAVGESTIPQTSQMQTLMSMEFDIPEFDFLGLKSPKSIQENITKNCGLKKVFAFIHHEENKLVDPNHGLQFGNIWRDENHLYRQDIDLFLLKTAEKYGAVVLQDTNVLDIIFNPENVVIKTDQEEFAAKYVADGTGYRSLIAKKLSLRDIPCRFNHHSRSLFTHMTDVTPFEEISKGNFKNKWSQGTLHHVFERGWIWVIPFNNWEGSQNANVSVGLTYDYRHYPLDENISPEEEFYSFIKRYPSVAEQFKNSKSTLPWSRTNRLQFSSSQMVGDRFSLLSHASDFIDPLYSRGMINTTEINRLLAKKLIEAFKTNDFSRNNFLEVESLQKKIVNFADRMANCSFISWSHFPLWNLVVRIWAIGMASLESNLGGHIKMYTSPTIRSKNVIEDFIFSPFEDPGFKKFFNDCESIILEFESKKISSNDAVTKLNQVIDQYSFTCVLPNLSKAHIWAIKNPGSRDLFLGDKNLTERWENKINDELI